jgi:predicted component of type VI protein secretion system
MTIELHVVQGRPSGKRLEFPPGEYYFGRGAECHVRPDSDWVSRQHCRLRVTRDAASIRDLGSRNGTLVNGRLVVGERLLLHGDQLQVGPLVFEVHYPEVVIPGDAGTGTMAGPATIREDPTVDLGGLADGADASAVTRPMDDAIPACQPTGAVTSEP